MAHSCPECGKHCHCSGDIDDINFGDWIGCKCDCKLYEDEEDYLEDEDCFLP